MQPEVLHRREGIQLRYASTISSQHATHRYNSYRTPHRIHDTCIYPRLSANGSTVIVYAHDEGLRVVWYGGRRFKANEESKTNQDSIDLTEDDETIQEHEDEDEEADSSHPFRRVLTHRDIIFGVSATKIAVPPLPTEADSRFLQTSETQIIALAACADMSLRLVAVPLQPQPEFSDQAQQIKIFGANSHQDLISDVALTITATLPEEDDAQSDRARSRSRPRDADDAAKQADTSRDWSFLLASTSSTGTGLLLIHQIAVDSRGQLSDDPEDHIPVQRRYLRCALASCHIAFNTALYPSPRHSNLLIASADGAATKVYQAIPSTSVPRKRRGSTATNDSASSAKQISRKGVPTDKTLIDLFTPFHQTGTQNLTPSRKCVLDAKWVLHGRAVLVLMDDGDWGIWDLEAAGPTSSTTNNLVKGQANVSGIQGGSITRFAVKGTIKTTGAATKKSSSADTKSASSTALAPMTPHTRKTRSEGFFKSNGSDARVEEPKTNRPKHGSVSVSVQLGSRNGQRLQDESVIFSYDSTNMVIPSIYAYWRSEIGGRGAFDGSATSRAIILPQLQTAGEEQKNTHLMPGELRQESTSLFATVRPTHDFLTATSSRLILFVTPLGESSAQTQASSIPLRPLADVSVDQDQALLRSGELDVDGMDRILDSMANSSTLPMPNSTALTNGLGRKSVGFLVDNDGDTEMETPTVQKSSKSRLVINKNLGAQEGGRRLFS